MEHLFHQLPDGISASAYIPPKQQSSLPVVALPMVKNAIFRVPTVALW